MGLVKRKGLETAVFVFFLTWLEGGDPGVEGGNDVGGGTFEEEPFRLVLRPSFPAVELCEEIRHACAGERRRSNEGSVLCRDAPDTTVFFIPIRMAIRGLVMTDDRIVPIGDVKGAVGSDPNLDGSEDVVFGLDDIGEELGGVKTGLVIVVQGVLLEGVAVITADDGAALHLFGEVAALKELHADLFDGSEEEIKRPRIDGEVTTDEAGSAVITADVSSALVKGLAVAGRDDTPAIRPGG